MGTGRKRPEEPPLHPGALKRGLLASGTRSSNSYQKEGKTLTGQARATASVAMAGGASREGGPASGSSEGHGAKPTPPCPGWPAKRGGLSGNQGRDSRSHRASSLHTLVRPAQEGRVSRRSHWSKPMAAGVLELGRGHALPSSSQRPVTSRETQAGTRGLDTNFIQLQIAPSPWGRS